MYSQGHHRSFFTWVLIHHHIFFLLHVRKCGYLHCPSVHPKKVLASMLVQWYDVVVSSFKGTANRIPKFYFAVLCRVLLSDSCVHDIAKYGLDVGVPNCWYTKIIQILLVFWSPDYSPESGPYPHTRKKLKKVTKTICEFFSTTSIQKSHKRA